ncbi:SH3-like domain-containing protein [Lactobacillus ultunensis]|uniref:SH3-like domain-containing protein n=1 Tax=Lactobacillus ultunensis TaxID=227945 RepID=UPI001912C668|nr:SH3-like domain-containing protein [Lactobacillus ultunensis]QQP27996.1 SH3-like domain-containing protein [Lactobacillus ultunensis]
MKYTSKILTATSAVALSVGLLMGYAKPVSAADSNSNNKTEKTTDSSSKSKKAPVQTSTSYDLMVKVGSGKHYNVYKKISNGKPVTKIADASDYQYSHIQSDQRIKTQNGTYWRIYVNGRKVGYVNQNYFTRNTIAVPKTVSLVRNSHYNFDPTDAISYVTNYMGTVIDSEEVNVSKDMIDCSNPGTYKVKYSYGNAKATVKVTVRKSTREGVADADSVQAKPFSGNLKSWKTYYGSSANYVTKTDFAPDKSRHTYDSDSGNLTFKTRFFQPVLLSVARDIKDDDYINRVGHIPEGITMSDGWLYTSLLSSTTITDGHIVGYNLNHLTNAFNGQYLLDMSQKKFNSYVKNIKVSPYIPIGHGQAMGSTDKYIYVLNNDNKVSYKSNLSEELIQIRKSDMCINKIWTIKCWNGGDTEGRYFQNGVVVNDHKIYTTTYNKSKDQTEYWEFNRTGDNWYPTMLGATKTGIVTNTYTQGFTYDPKNDNFYLAFNDVIAKIAKNGEVKDTYQFHTGREIEGIAVENNRLYTNLAQRAELLESTQKLTK